MVCRDSKLASVAIAMTKRAVWLDDSQVRSLLHQLRHEGEELHEQWDAPKTAAVLAGLIAQLRSEVAADPSLRPQRRAGLLERLKQAEQQPADPRILHAVSQLRIRAAGAELHLRYELHVLAGALGLSGKQVRAEFDLLRRERKGRSKVGDNARRLRPGLPTDAATRHALCVLADRTAASPAWQPRTVTDWTDVDAASVASVGYDSDSRRLEVRRAGGSVEAYRDVPPELAALMCRPSTAARARSALRGTANHDYPNAEADLVAAFSVRCDDCGRFVGAAHRCPARHHTARVEGPITRVMSLPVGMTMLVADPDRARALLDSDTKVVVAVASSVPAATPLARSVTGAHSSNVQAAYAAVGTVRGDARVDRVGVALHVDTATLRCDCEQYAGIGRCRHLGIAAAALVEELRSREHEQRQAGTMYEHLAGECRTRRSVTPARFAPLPVDLSTIDYSQNPQAFADDVRSARDEAGKPVVWMIDEAMYGYGQGRAFRVELQLDTGAQLALASSHARAAAVAATLCDAGTQAPRHAAQPGRAELTGDRTGDDPGEHHHDETVRLQRAGSAGPGDHSWCAEEGSGAGAVDSLGLGDTAATWRELERVCGRLAQEGSAVRAGGHVRVAAADLCVEPVDVGRLFGLVAEYHDDLHRMIHRPRLTAGVLRGGRASDAPPALGFLEVAALVRFSSWPAAVNVSGSSAYLDMEVHLYDAGRQAGSIQAQVKLAAALVDYAARHPEESLRQGRPVRAGAAPFAEMTHANPDAMNAATWADVTSGVRELIDRFMRRDIDKRQMAALWAAGCHRSGRD